ncbi:MAG: hypothetical protein GY940_34845 [bacterium]|nr:hypothetical protein [bacterium]
MKNKRRRIFYIDHIFQKKLLLLFLGINLVMVAANIIYYMIHLKGALEDNLFRSHIVISNVSEVLAGEVLAFNILLAVISLVLVLILYTFTRLKLKSFFDKIKKALTSRQTQRVGEAYKFRIPEEFQEIHQVLGTFIERADEKLGDQEKRIEAIKSS